MFPVSDDNYWDNGDAFLEDKSPEKLLRKSLIIFVWTNVSMIFHILGQNLRLFLSPFISTLCCRYGHDNCDSHEQVTPPRAICAKFLAYKIHNLLFSKPAKVWLLQAIVYEARDWAIWEN